MPDEPTPAPGPDAPASDAGPARGAGRLIDLKGAQVTDQRMLGPLGAVLVVERPDGVPPEAWSGCDRIVLRALHPEEDESDEAVARLREDAEALAGLELPGLVRVLGFAKHKSQEFVAVEYPSGETLRSLVSRREPPPAGALAIGRAVAAALGLLARLGRPHRDFGCEAVFVARDGSVLVLPVACPRDFRVEHKVSPRGSYRGAPLYAAPELHESGGLSPTERSNVFSFGVAFYEMLAFQDPFRGGTPTRMLVDVAETTPRAPSTVVTGLAPELDRICLRCMEKDPERRFPGFAAVESTLRIASESVALGRAAPGGTGGEAARRPQSTRELVDSRSKPFATPSGPGLPSTPSFEPGAARHAPSARRMSGRQRGLLVASATIVVAALGLAALGLLARGTTGRSTESLANDVFLQAKRLADRGMFESAFRLLDSHRDRIRDVDPRRYDDLLRTARSSYLTEQGDAARAEGRWDDAVRAFEEALADAAGEPGRPALALRLQEARYRAELARAEAAEASGDWRASGVALAKALALGPERGVPESELAPVRADAEFAGVMVEASDARDAGDADAEKERLLKAAGQRPGAREVMERLAALGAGPKASEEALARSREALLGGERREAERLAREAAALWPFDERPGQVLAYLADRSSCELGGTVFVSPVGPWESWGPKERAEAFCIDPYESRSEGERLPRTLVSAVEAAAECLKRGARLCRAAEFELACAGPQGLLFPYGNVYRFDACNTAGRGPVAPGSSIDCRSPFGVYDMSGNVAEWAADFVRGKGQIVAGGDWSSGESGASCRARVHFDPRLTSPRVGFRCCRSLADAPAGGQDPENGRPGE